MCKSKVLAVVKPAYCIFQLFWESQLVGKNYCVERGTFSSAQKSGLLVESGAKNGCYGDYLLLRSGTEHHCYIGGTLGTIR